MKKTSTSSQPKTLIDVFVIHDTTPFGLRFCGFAQAF